MVNGLLRWLEKILEVELVKAMQEDSRRGMGALEIEFHVGYLEESRKKELESGGGSLAAGENGQVTIVGKLPSVEEVEATRRRKQTR